MDTVVELVKRRVDATKDAVELASPLNIQEILHAQKADEFCNLD